MDGGTTQNDFTFTVVKRLKPDVELNAWVQYERWKSLYTRPADRTTSQRMFRSPGTRRRRTPFVSGSDGRRLRAAPGWRLVQDFGWPRGARQAGWSAYLPQRGNDDREDAGVCDASRHGEIPGRDFRSDNPARCRAVDGNLRASRNCVRAVSTGALSLTMIGIKRAENQSDE